MRLVLLCSLLICPKSYIMHYIIRQREYVLFCHHKGNLSSYFLCSGTHHTNAQFTPICNSTYDQLQAVQSFR